MKMSGPGVQIYASLGKCILCLAPERPDFTKEHIIPSGLTGKHPAYIAHGSCPKCNGRANELYEGKALATDFKTARYVLGLKRRRKGRKQKPLEPHWVAYGGHPPQGELNEGARVVLAPDEYPGIIQFGVLPVAGLLVGEDRQTIELPPLVYGNTGTHTKLTKQVTVREVHNFAAFALTIAKAGYSFAVAHMGLDAFDGEEIRALLRGERGDMFNFVGTNPEESEPPTDELHRITIVEWEGLVIAMVRLFSKYRMPTYHVVLGKKCADRTS